jgi:ANTAR domain
MLTKEEYADAQALRCQGWSISAIARHLARDRKTVRSYLGGERIAGVRSSALNEFQRFLPYCRQRLADAAHLPAAVLFDEVVALGYPGGYSTFTRALRKHRVRPLCTLCRRNCRSDGTTVRHPAREEVRFAWLRLPDPPERWGCGSRAHLLVGMLVNSGRWRAVLTESEEFPQLAEAIDRVLRRLGGTGGIWRFERSMAVCSPSTGKVTRAFAQLAEFYGVGIGFPSWQGSRNFLADEDLRSISHDWWRTVGRDTRIQAAQDNLDQLATWTESRRATARAARAPGAAPTAAQGLRSLPSTPFPAQVCVMRTVDAQGLVPFRGNAYAVPPDLADASVEVRWRLDETCLSIATARGAVIARHTLAPHGAGQTVVGRSQAITLERPAHAVRTRAVHCPAKSHSTPSTAALAEARALRGHDPTEGQLQRTLQDRIIVAQAKGVLAARRGITVEEAFELLREHARSRRLSLGCLAREIIDGTADAGLLGRASTPCSEASAN